MKAIPFTVKPLDPLDPVILASEVLVRPPAGALRFTLVLNLRGQPVRVDYEMRGGRIIRRAFIDRAGILVG